MVYPGYLGCLEGLLGGSGVGASICLLAELRSTGHGAAQQRRVQVCVCVCHSPAALRNVVLQVKLAAPFVARRHGIAELEVEKFLPSSRHVETSV